MSNDVLMALIAEVNALKTRVAELASREGDRRAASGTPIYPGLTAGRVLFAGASKELDDDAALVWDDASKRLGLGTTAPGVALDVASTSSAGLFTRIRSSAANSNNGLAIANDARTWSLQVRGAESDNFALVDESVPARRLVVDTNGRMGIGTDTPGVALDIVSTTSAGLFTRIRSSAADSNNGLAIANDARTYSIQVRGAESDSLRIIDESAVAHRLVLSSGGYVRIGDGTLPSYRLELPNTANTDGQGRANAWVTYSSRERKRNIKEPPRQVVRDRIKALRAVEWEPEEGDGRDVGLIAEDVLAVWPELVSGDPAQPETLGLKYDRLGAALLPLVQDHDARVDALEAENRALRERLAALEQRLERLERNAP